MNFTPNTENDMPLLAASLLLNAVSFVTQDTASFALSIIVSGFAIAHYVISIKKNLKNDK
jgi:hypothetical protein